MCSAADELGVRFLLARGWADRNYPEPLMETAEVAVERARAVRGRWDGRGDDRMRVELAPPHSLGLLRRGHAGHGDRGPVAGAGALTSTAPRPR